MSCTNCFNGCAETVSDQCIRYTGNDVPALGIQHGDTLLSVENAITTFLSSTLTGVGIKPIIDDNIICHTVKQYLPACTICTGFTLNEVLTAIIKAACNLQVQIDAINATLTTLNADYTIGCLTGVTASSDTHAIVQAIITKLCLVDSNLTTLTSELHTLYSSNGDELNAQIANYLNSNPSSSFVYSKMIPFTVIPFYPTPSFLSGKFDSTGAGIGDWINIYLCNGQNGTPDLRGNVLIGANSMGTNAYSNHNTDPNSPYNNFYYNQGTLNGTNTVILTPPQIPAHTHGAVSTDAGHVHTTYADVKYNAAGAGLKLGSDINIAAGSNITGTGFASVTTTVLANTPAGGAHANVQPSIGVLYIMYIP